MSLEDLQRRAEGQAKTPVVRTLRRRCVPVTAGELREAAARHPDHPVAKDFRNAVDRVPDGKRLYVEAEDLQGLLENRAVIVKEFYDEEKDEVVDIKELGEPLGPIVSPAAITTPAVPVDTLPPSVPVDTVEPAVLEDKD